MEKCEANTKNDEKIKLLKMESKEKARKKNLWCKARVNCTFQGILLETMPLLHENNIKQLQQLSMKIFKEAYINIAELDTSNNYVREREGGDVCIIREEKDGEREI